MNVPVLFDLATTVHAASKFVERSTFIGMLPAPVHEKPKPVETLKVGELATGANG